ncbi:hypothetical protein PR202_ga06830 [Eleusine coracana subsp. coracana]|uniref:Uncharacterized protein n=1 Tax=Eleusine coracana subsp. coracana TaxID=191504 RepID=A0AAV5BW03_ELECO|nr:hypothetical protein PR202_ga06830 [Eleusine coracana subsp. coracana]
MSSSSSSLALAAVALSGSLVIFSLCRAHMSAARAAVLHGTGPASMPLLLLLPPHQVHKRRRGRRTVVRRKAEKRVRFAADVVDNEGAPRPVRSSPSMSAAAGPASSCRGAVEERMPLPANREALYRGMLRDRSAHRVTCTY